MSVSKSLRFEVFERDGFSCVYCGAYSFEGNLEVDRIAESIPGLFSTEAK